MFAGGGLLFAGEVSMVAEVNIQIIKCPPNNFDDCGGWGGGLTFAGEVATFARKTKLLKVD